MTLTFSHNRALQLIWQSQDLLTAAVTEKEMHDAIVKSLPLMVRAEALLAEESHDPQPE